MSAFVEADRRLLGQVLNHILPAGAGLPAGGALGVVTYVEEAIGRDPTQRRLFLEGLGAIAATCHARHGNAFEDAGERDQDDVLREVHSARPDFFDALLVHAYSGYYSNPEIVHLLGLEVWPPQPRGHHLAPFDPSLLQIVKDRPPLYRPTP